MSKSIASAKVKVYLRNNWIKIGIAVLFLFILMKKDLSFSVDLNAPTGSPVQQKMAPQAPKPKETKKDILSERKPEEEESAITKLFVAPLNNFLAGKEESSDKFWLMDEDDMVDFINRFTHVAENEQLKYGVPASIILSSSLLLSEAGSSELSRAGNNFFALPCTADWMGKEDQYGGKCFRHYENAWTSFRDNSLYLTTYLFPGKKLPPDDHKSWVTALEQVNYAEEPNLAAQLIKIINHFDLDELDK
ncbi:MAG: glucosaminidase domain-containing protein [Lewinellaceae bacterium]|nr:glucosaminidase domain-containing protein [Lewinellaceae bacterium]